MTAAELQQLLEDNLAALPSTVLTHAERKQAIARFGDLGWPHRRIETWRYTDLSKLAQKNFEFETPADSRDTLESAAELLAQHPPVDGAERTVFLGGRRIDSLSDGSADEDLQIAANAIERSSDASEPALTAFNSAFALDSTRILVSGKSKTPRELVFVTSNHDLNNQARLFIEMSAASDATLILRHIAPRSARDTWVNLVVDIEAHEGSQLRLHRLQQNGDLQYHTALHRAVLQRNARLTAGNIELGGALVRNEFQIRLDGEGAESDIFGLAVTRGQQHCDTRIAVDHRAPHTRSRQTYRAILSGSSRSVFNGKVSVQPDAQHIDARQRNDNLLLSSKSEADSKPELEIYADQVVCSHGATVGELPEDHLFYLRSRGIDAATARSILTQAFADAILNRFELEAFEQLARETTRRLLPDLDRDA